MNVGVEVIIMLASVVLTGFAGYILWIVKKNNEKTSKDSEDRYTILLKNVYANSKSSLAIIDVIEGSKINGQIASAKKELKEANEAYLQYLIEKSSQ